MGGRLGGWGVESAGDEAGQDQESFMNGVSEMVCPFYDLELRIVLGTGEYGVVYALYRRRALLDPIRQKRYDQSTFSCTSILTRSCVRYTDYTG